MSYNPTAGGGSVSSASITDATDRGRALLTAATLAEQRAAMGLTVLVLATSSQTVTNSATLTNSALTFTAAANTKYRVMGLVLLDTTALGDYKFDFNGPASPTLVRIVTNAIVAGATAFSQIRVETAFAQSRTQAGTGTTGAMVRFEGVIHNGANAGAVTFRFAQGTQTNDSGVVLREGSYLEYATV